ncbi:MAG: sulfatase [Bacteroidota bacterium]
MKKYTGLPYIEVNSPLTKLIKWKISVLIGICWVTSCQPTITDATHPPQKRPNILLAISDDQSFPHVSIHGCQELATPHFDRVAREGVWFRNAFTSSPGCSPSRAAILTGLHSWQLGAAGTHASHFDTSFVVFPDLLEGAGYAIGFTGKGWGPGNWEISGRTRNPAGPAWQEHTLKAPEGINNKDYTANFREFLNSRDDDQPFYFWFGAHEPHRKFKKGLGKELGKDPSNVEVPTFLPDHEVVRSDMLDYFAEIEWFDKHLGQMIALLEDVGELENTLIIVTSDNGMAFPRAKANLYEYGFHVPLAMRWGEHLPKGLRIERPVSLVDLAPTILAATQTQPSANHDLPGSSLLNGIQAKTPHVSQPDFIISGRERHSSSRFHSLGYPQRAIRTSDFLYIYNFHPERWPAGAPQKYGKGNYPSNEELMQRQLGPMYGAYHDIDACPTMDFLIEMQTSEYEKFLQGAVDFRPQEELFAISDDLGCLENLANNPNYSSLKDSLNEILMSYLSEKGDPRLLGKGDMWETYPRYSRLREFPTPEWAIDNPLAIPEQEWLKQR